MEDQLTYTQAVENAQFTISMEYPLRCTNIDCDKYDFCDHTKTQMSKCNDYLKYRYLRVKAMYRPDIRGRIKLCLNCRHYKNAIINKNGRKCKVKRGLCSPFDACAKWERKSHLDKYGVSVREV